MYATDLSDPISQSFPLGRGKAEEGELLDALVANLNSQHQWLLAYAYEAFERYYKDLYGAIGYLDRNIWRGSDFGKERIKDLKNKKFHWFQEQARVTIAKTNIKEILGVLREKIAGFESHEKSNPKGVDYQFMIVSYGKGDVLK